MLILFWIFATALIFHIGLGAKKVLIDHEFLYISNFFRKEKVPLAFIEAVSSYRMFNPNPVYIKLKEETSFGTEIMFLARTEFNLFWEHSIVEELMLAAKMARGEL